ncbi:MAG: hypothetical protein Q9164_006902, partial [Protoblastenia rupestris]
MPFFKRSLAGPAYVILNGIRVCNVIALLSVVAASFVMLVKTFTVSKFFFFDGVSHLVRACISIALIITEIGLFRRYIATNWPLLSPAHGFVTLATVMLILGVSILGNLNKEATSQKNLGTSMWQCVISSGIITCIIGIVNIFASYMFRQKSLEITARMIRAHGVQAPQKVTPYISPLPSNRPSQRRRSFLLNRSNTDVLPSYHTNKSATRNISEPIGRGGGAGLGFSAEKRASSVYEDAANGREGGIHLPPVVNGVPKPDLAHHPYYQGR